MGRGFISWQLRGLRGNAGFPRDSYWVYLTLDTHVDPVAST